MKKNVPVQEKGEQETENLQEQENSVEEMIQEPEDGTESEDQEPEGGSDGEDREPEDSTEGETQEPEDAPKDLIAIYPILYHSHQYKIGNTLPANDPEMVKAWLDAGTAKWEMLDENKVKVRPGTALPGLPGRATYSKAGSGDDLAGRIPERGSGKK